MSHRTFRPFPALAAALLTALLVLGLAGTAQATARPVAPRVTLSADAAFAHVTVRASEVPGATKYVLYINGYRMWALARSCTFLGWHCARVTTIPMPRDTAALISVQAENAAGAARSRAGTLVNPTDGAVLHGLVQQGLGVRWARFPTPTPAGLRAAAAGFYRCQRVATDVLIAVTFADAAFYDPQDVWGGYSLVTEGALPRNYLLKMLGNHGIQPVCLAHLTAMVGGYGY